MTNEMHSVTWSADGVLTIDSAQDCVEVQPALQSFLMPDLPGTQKLAEPAYGYTAADLYAFADAAIKLNRATLAERERCAALTTKSSYSEFPNKLSKLSALIASLPASA